MSTESATLGDLTEVEARLDRRIDELRNDPELPRQLEEAHNEIVKLQSLVAILQDCIEGIGASARSRYAAMSATTFDIAEQREVSPLVGR